MSQICMPKLSRGSVFSLDQRIKLHELKNLKKGQFVCKIKFLASKALIEQNKLKGNSVKDTVTNISSFLNFTTVKLMKYYALCSVYSNTKRDYNTSEIYKNSVIIHKKRLFFSTFQIIYLYMRESSVFRKIP